LIGFHIAGRYDWIFGSFRLRLSSYCADRQARRNYVTLSIEEVRRRRTSDKVFIFGSGSSIKKITADEWAHFSQFDTFSYSQFGRNRQIPIRFHMVAEILVFEEFLEIYRNNPQYRDTIYVVQEGWPAVMGNQFVASGVIEEGRPLVRFKRTKRGKFVPPTKSIREGIVHTANSVSDMVNLAFLFGWKEIVLVGVDLVDRRYFYLGDSETQKLEFPGLTYASPFPGGDAVLKLFKIWSPYLRSQGVKLSIYNPHSLLAAELPVYDPKLTAQDLN
jgi:hypothetical protein